MPNPGMKGTNLLCGASVLIVLFLSCSHASSPAARLPVAAAKIEAAAGAGIGASWRGLNDSRSLSCEVCKLPRCAETSGKPAHKIAKRQLAIDIANAFIGFFGQLLFCIANCNIIGDPSGVNTIACAISCIGTLFANLGSNLFLAVGISSLTTG